MSSSPSRVVHTLYGPKVRLPGNLIEASLNSLQRVNTAEAPQENSPLPGAPVIRFSSSPEPSQWSTETHPPAATPIRRTGSGRRAPRTGPISPYARPNYAPYLPLPPHSAPPSTKIIWENDIRAWEEQMHRNISHFSTATINYLNNVERDRDGYKLRAEKAEGQLHAMGKMLSSLALRDANRSPSAPSTPENELMQRFSSAGPLRRKPVPSKSSRFEWASSVFGLSRCKSADPCLTSRSHDDFFDVTITGYPLPPQPGPARRTSEPELIRDASRPNESPRLSRAPYGPGEIDIQHIDILYIPSNGRLFCRPCQ